MAVWYVRLPASVAKPRIRVQSSCATTDGVSSSATSTQGVSRSCSRSRGPPFSPRMFMRNRPATSCRSPLRSRRYGSSTSLKTAASSSSARCTAHSALTRSSTTMVAARPTSSGSSSMSSCASKMAARSAPLSSAMRPRICFSCSCERRRARSSADSSRATRSGATGKRMTCVRWMATSAGPVASPEETPMPFRRSTTPHRTPTRPAAPAPPRHQPRRAPRR